MKSVIRTDAHARHVRDPLSPGFRKTTFGGGGAPLELLDEVHDVFSTDEVPRPVVATSPVTTISTIHDGSFRSEARSGCAYST